MKSIFNLFSDTFLYKKMNVIMRKDEKIIYIQDYTQYLADNFKFLLFALSSSTVRIPEEIMLLKFFGLTGVPISTKTIDVQRDADDV